MRAVLIHNRNLNARGAKLTPRPQKTEQRESEQSGRPLAMSPSLWTIRTCEFHQNSRAFSIRTSPNPEPVPNRWSRCAAPSAQGGRRPPEDTGRPADEVGCWGGQHVSMSGHVRRDGKFPGTTHGVPALQPCCHYEVRTF